MTLILILILSGLKIIVVIAVISVIAVVRGTVTTRIRRTMTSGHIGGGEMKAHNKETLLLV